MKLLNQASVFVLLCLLPGPVSCGCPALRRKKVTVAEAEIPETACTTPATTTTTTTAVAATATTPTTPTIPTITIAYTDQHNTRNLQTEAWPARAPTTTPAASFCRQNNFQAATPSKASICRARTLILDSLEDLLDPTQDVPSSTPTASPTSDPEVTAVLTRSNLFGIAVRLAFHDAGEADLSAEGSGDRMGPDGCLSNTPGNGGLVEAESLVVRKIEPLWQQVCGGISRADFWALFASIVVETAASEPTSINFSYGRRDAVECEAGGAPAGRGGGPRGGACDL